MSCDSIAQRSEAVANPMTKLSVLIVDDEILARERVRSFLRTEPSVEIGGEFGDGIAALEAIRQQAPDIVFLDVQIPGIDGLKVLAELPADSRPSIILVTAYDRYAVGAFAAKVVDYLLKPFDRERFQLALSRAIDEIRTRRADDLEKRIEQALTIASARQLERLVVRIDGRQIFLKPDDIEWVEAEHNYSTIHLAGAKPLLISELISSIEKRLSASCFLRVSRSALVNADHVRELHTNDSGDHVILLRNGTHVPISRHLRGHLVELLRLGCTSSRVPFRPVHSAPMRP
jgi:two-component system LytT family response regulator